MNKFEELYYEAKSDKWFQNLALFCRISLAASFLPAGYVKIMGQRFAEGLSHHHPLARYFEALLATGYYYTFIGITQVITAILILIPRTALLGTLIYFCMIINITVLTYATRFHGTRIVTIMALACLYLLLWDYERIKHILPFKQPHSTSRVMIKPASNRLKLVFFGSCIAALSLIIMGTPNLYEITIKIKNLYQLGMSIKFKKRLFHEIVPCNLEEDTRNQCPDSKNAEACKAFCDCIYKQGKPLDSCLAVYHKAKGLDKSDRK